MVNNFIFNEPINNIVKKRKSIRTYNTEEISSEIIGKLNDYISEINGPFKENITFKILDVKERINGAKLGTYGVIKGANKFIAAKVKDGQYSLEELGQIIQRTASLLEVECTSEGAMEIAKCSRGTPRLANRLLKRVRDIVWIKYEGHINQETALEALKLLNIDTYGLDEIDRRILNTIAYQFKGGPVGLETLAATIGEERETLEDVYEPYLMQQGLLQRTPRGRMLTDAAKILIKMPPELNN